MAAVDVARPELTVGAAAGAARTAAGDEADEVPAAVVVSQANLENLVALLGSVPAIAQGLLVEVGVAAACELRGTGDEERKEAEACKKSSFDLISWYVLKWAGV